MATNKKQKSALEQSMSWASKAASNVFGGAKTTFQNFYDRFSQDYDAHKKQQQQKDIIQRQKIGQFAQAAASGINTFVNKPFDIIGQKMAKLNQTIPTKYTPLQRFSISLPQAAQIVGQTYGGQLVKPYQWAGGKAAETYAKLTKSPQAATLAKFIQSPVIPEVAGRTLGGITKALVSGPISQYNPQMTRLQKAGEAVGTLGALMSPVSTISGGILNVPFHAILTGLTEKRLISKQEAAEAYSSGIEFTAKLGPLAKVLEGISTPLLAKFGLPNTETVKSAIQAYIRYKGTKLENAAWKTLVGEVIKQTPQRAAAGGLSMGAFGATLPAENTEQFKKNIFDNALQGVVFESVLGGAGPLVSSKLARPPEGYTFTQEKPESIAAKRLAELNKKAETKSLSRLEQTERAFLETRANDPQAIKELYRLVDEQDLIKRYGVPTAETQYRKSYGELMPAEDIRAAQDAIQYLDTAKSVDEFMSPKYQEAEMTIRRLTTNYVDAQMARTASINELLKPLNERVMNDAPEAFNLEKKAIVEGTAPIPGVRQALGDTGMQIGKTEEFRTAPTANFDMAKGEAEGAIKSMFSDREIRLITGEEGSITTPQGVKARGKYYDSIISVIENNGKVESKTVYHEAFHAYADKFVEAGLYRKALQETVTQGQAKNEAAAAEYLAEGFADYVAGRKTFTGQILAFFEQLFNAVKGLMGKEQSARQIYENILTQKRPPATTLIGITSAQPASPVTSMIIGEGNRLFKAGQIDAGLAKLQEATTLTEPQLTRVLREDGTTQIKTLETGTHGLYFGIPEPSYFLEVKSTDLKNTAASIAKFAKVHNQESFIMGTASTSSTATPGIEFGFGRALTNPEILQIEKVFNDNGIGLTLNQKTGEGYALNIKDFDGLEPGDWTQKVLTIVDTLKGKHSYFTHQLDNFDVKVYNKGNYDQLINEQNIQLARGTQKVERAGREGRTSLQEEITTRGDVGNLATTNTDGTPKYRLTEDQQLALNYLNKQRGYTPKEPETEQVLKYGNKTRLRELEVMKEDFQSQVDHIDGIIKNYDLFKAKTEGDILATIEQETVNVPLRNLLNKIHAFSQGTEGKTPIIEGGTRFLTKTALKQVRSELAKNIKEVNNQIITTSREMVTREKTPYTPTNEELAMNQLRKSRGETIEKPQETAPPVFEKPTTPETKPMGTTEKPTIPSTTTTAQGSRETPTVGQQERGHVTTVREKSDVRSGVKEEVAGNYNMETDEGRIRYGADYVEKNFETAKERALSAEPLSNELAGIHHGLKTKLTQLADTAEKSGNTKEAVLYDDQLAQIENNLAEKLTPGAQVLQFMRNWVDRTPQSLLRWVKRIYSEANQLGALSPGRLLKRVTGQTYKLELTSDVERRITTEMMQINRIKDESLKFAAMHKLIREVVKDIPPSILELTSAYRYQNMLINPLTQLRNIYHNLKNAVVLRPLALAASGDLKGAGSYYRHLTEGVKRGAGEWFAAMKGGRVLGGGKYAENSYQQLRTISRAVNQERIPGILKIAGNMLEGADLFFTELIANSEYYVLKNKGLSDANAKNQAYLTAARYLYRKKLDPTNSSGQGLVLSKFDAATDAILKLRSKLPFGSWFLPFVRVPMAVAKAGLEWSPLGVTTIYKANNGQEQAGKALVGSLFLLAGAAKASSGETTWMAPTDKEEKTRWYDSGRKPFSVRVDNNPMLSWMANLPGSYKDKYDYAWMPMNYMGELGYSFALPAAFKYYSDETKTALTDDQLTKIAKTLGGFVNYWTGQTPIEGLQGWVDMARGDQTYTTGRQLGFTAGQVIPLEGFLSFVSNIIDPIYRESKTFTSEFLRSIPGYSKQLPPIMTGYGTPASRNLSNFVAPYGVGYGTDAFEPALQNRRQELQQNAVLNQFKKEATNRAETAVKMGTTPAGKEGAAANKKFLEGLYETYDTVDDEQIRAKIRQTIEGRGYDFTEGYQKYLNKETQISTQGLSEEAAGKLGRSNEFSYVRQLFKKDQGNGAYTDLISEAMQKYDITPEDYYYDEKTALPDDVQYDEIISSIGDLDYDSMMKTLISYRKVSEGTRKPLLTDTLVNKLNKEGYLTDSVSDYLKAVDWNSTDKTFEYNPPKSTIKKSAFKFDLPQTTIKTPKLKLSTEKRAVFKPLRKKTIAKPRLPTMPAYKSVQFKTPTLKIRTPVRSLGGLGRLK